MENHSSYFGPVKGNSVCHSLLVSWLSYLLFCNIILYWSNAGLQCHGWLRHRNPMSLQSPLLAEEQLWALLSQRLLRVLPLGCCTHEVCPVQQGTWWPPHHGNNLLQAAVPGYECTLPVFPWAAWAAGSEFLLQSLGPAADPITDVPAGAAQPLLRKCGDVPSIAASQSPLWSFQCLKDVVIKETCYKRKIVRETLSPL